MLRVRILMLVFLLTSLVLYFVWNSEDDLLHSHPITLDIELLRQAFIHKLQEMKRNKALKRFGNRRNCSENTSPNTACVDTACNSTLPPATSDVNFWNVFKPLTRVKDVTGRLSEALGPYRSASKVIFVTAASSNHFKESQALMKNLHQTVFPRLKNYTFYFYDLGLTSKQRQQVIHQLAQSLYGDKIVVVLV
ncbi:uncharacterized protein LOC121390780 isoform X2 [Gigantopelta aegis]|uniref:uncharacterized protein LOC121390780 isoform X2 n=1 Tax=Gigantopelta aegis TaxID=1735272 RepID=UPI001B88BA03|nr:uncharacterized protein LOC121390780 isoform X2 [Gigantopelta aegis]